MFLNIVMLAGIAGAAVPLVLHLLNRARYRNVVWGAMMFLHSGDARRRQSMRLRQWIILAVRMAVVALLAVALARPVAAGHLGALGPNANITAVILLDHSGSMGYGRPGQTRMDQAREAVRQIISTLRRGDEAALITLGDFARNPAPRPTADLQSIIDSLDNPQFQAGGAGVTNIADGLTLAANLFERQNNRNRELFIVCDRQATNWRGVTERMAAAWRQRVTATGPLPRFIVIPVGGWETDNLAIESVTVASPQMVVGQPVDIQITVHNYGSAPRADLPLSVFVDQQWVAATTANVPPSASTTVTQSLRIRTSGSHVITVRTQPDGISRDEQFSLAADVVLPIDVLVVRDSSPILGAARRADYLTLALMPFAAAGHAGGDATAVRLFTSSATDDWTNLDSQRFHVVILDGISQITPAQARALEQHVYGGGGLLVSPGSRTRIDNFNELLYRDGAGILPASLGRPTAADGSEATTVLGIDLAHPIFSFLRGLPDPIPSATIGRYFHSAPRQPDGQVLASYACGQPMLVAGNFGRGKVLLITTPLDEDWSTLPLGNFYLPMVQSMVRFLDSRPSRNLAPGEPIVAQFDSGKEPVATVTAPDGARQDVPLQSAGDAFEARYAATAQPGIYTVVRGLQTQHFVIMSPREESDLTPLAPRRWQELSSQLGFTLVEMSRTPIASVLPDEHSTHEMWAILLAGVLALGLTELALGRAWSAGTSRTQLP
jgi:hypothetical protein